MDPLDLKKRFYDSILKPRAEAEDLEARDTTWPTIAAKPAPQWNIHEDPDFVPVHEREARRKDDQRRRLDAMLLEWLDKPHLQGTGRRQSPSDLVAAEKDDPEYKDRLLNKKIERDLLEEEEEQ
jgi:hypothetical protein